MPLSEQVKPIPHNVAMSFPRYGSLIATFLVLIIMYIPMCILALIDDPLGFMQGLTTPRIIFYVLGFLFILAPMCGYVWGIIPIFLTGQFFQYLIRPHLSTATKKTFLYYAACAAMMWSPLLLLGLFGSMALMFSAGFLFCVILPTSLFCGWLEWRQYSKLKHDVDV